MALSLLTESVGKKNINHWFIVATVCIGAFMAALDASIINIALPSLERSFNVQMNQIEWVSLVYLLSLASLIIIFGRLADLFGRKWFYAIGFLIFILSSLFCGLSSTLPLLLIGRVCQGVGAAMLQANSVSIITAATPPEDRGKAIGIQASAQGIGLSLGPLMGGLLIQFFNWKWLFFVNVPVGLIGTLLGIWLLPKDGSSCKNEAFDWLGALFLIPFLISVIYVLNMGLKQGWGTPLQLTLYIVAILSFSIFIYLEQKVKDPLIDLNLFKIRPFSLGNLTGMLAFSVMYAVLLLTPYFLERAGHLSSFTTGLMTTIIPIGMTLSTPIAGKWSDKFGARFPMIAGMILTTFGCSLLIFLDGPLHYIWLCAGIFFVGLGLGTFTPPNNSNVMGHTPNNRLGVAGGILNMSRTLGMGLGVTLGGLTYQIFESVYGHSNQLNPTKAYSSAFLVLTLLSIGTLLVTWRSHSKSGKLSDEN